MATKEQDVITTSEEPGLDLDWLLDAYRTMVTARRLDDREIALKRQNKIFFQISGAGHEAIQVAMAAHLKSGHDWFYLYYRDRALALALGQTPLDHLLGAVGAHDDRRTARAARCRPHFGDIRYNIASASSPTGTQFLQAVGAAEAGMRVAQVPELEGELTGFHEDEVVVVSSGDGATSEGEFWEALNSACNLKLPVVFLIEDNGYAISVPVEINTAGGSISKLVASFPDLFIRECDGTDVVDSYRAAGEAVAYCRSRKGPALLHAHTIRPYSHSMSDDERMYRPTAEREEEAKRDPLLRTRTLLINEQIASPDELDELEEEIHAAVSAAADEAETHPQPNPDTVLQHLFSEEVDATGPDFDTEDSPDFKDDRHLTVVDLLNACMRDEMERNPRIVVFGQDVADASREEILPEGQGQRRRVQGHAWPADPLRGGTGVQLSPRWRRAS